MNHTVSSITSNGAYSDYLFTGDCHGVVSMLDIERQEVITTYDPMVIHPQVYSQAGITYDPVDSFFLLFYIDLFNCY